MADEPSIPQSALQPGQVSQVGRWAVGTQADGTSFAVSRRCRHQLADLSRGTLDKNGCLVCPWHGARYDTHSGRMVEGPKGFLGYVGKTPGYTEFVKAYSQVLRLRVGRVVVRGGRAVVRGRRTPEDRGEL
jgi:nitrite reductase/ring-hydroxylating ferredoxin subunit